MLLIMVNCVQAWCKVLKCVMHAVLAATPVCVNLKHDGHENLEHLNLALLRGDESLINNFGRRN